MKTENSIISKGYELLEMQLKINRKKITDENVIESHNMEIQEFKENHSDILKEKFSKIK